MNFIDTADSYGPESNESLISQALHPYPTGLVIATKGGLVRPNRRSWIQDGRPDHFRRAVEGSLQRLRLDRIDLYQFHAPDPNVPYIESIGALVDLQRIGKIRHIGISNVTVAQLELARSIASIVSVQNMDNLRSQTSEDVLAACERLGIAFLPWYPLGGKRGLRALKIKQAAERCGLTHVALSLAWLLTKSPVMLPISGTQSIDHLEDNVRATALRLAPGDFGVICDSTPFAGSASFAKEDLRMDKPWDGFPPILAFRILLRNRVQRQLECGSGRVLGMLSLMVRF